MRGMTASGTVCVLPGPPALLQQCDFHHPVQRVAVFADMAGRHIGRIVTDQAVFKFALAEFRIPLRTKSTRAGVPMFVERMFAVETHGWQVSFER